jgi:hypothetical protein
MVKEEMREVCHGVRGLEQVEFLFMGFAASRKAALRGGFFVRTGPYRLRQLTSHVESRSITEPDDTVVNARTLGARSPP